MFASSLTENQIISGVIAIAFLILSLFAGDLNSGLNNLSIMNFYQKFPAGIISIKEIIGLVSFSAMFIGFTIIVMQRRKMIK